MDSLGKTEDAGSPSVHMHGVEILITEKLDAVHVCRCHGQPALTDGVCVCVLNRFALDDDVAQSSDRCHCPADGNCHKVATSLARAPRRR